MENRPPEVTKKFFSTEFSNTQDDNRLLAFFQHSALPLVNSFIMQGYTKNDIADGMITAINMWRNKL